MCFFKKNCSGRLATIALLSLLLAVSCSRNTRVKEHRLSPADSTMAANLIEVSDQVRFSNPDSALILLSQLGALHRRAGDVNGLIDYYIHVQYIYSIIMPDSTTSLKYLDSIQRLVAQPGNEVFQYKALCAQGDYFFSIGNDYPKAISYYIEALKLQPKPVDSIFFLNIHGALAQIHYEQDNLQEASDYFEPLLQRVATKPDGQEKVAVFINGYCFANKETKEGRERARKYIFTAKQIADKLKDSAINNMLFINLSSYYQNLGMDDSCAFYAQKAIDNITDVSKRYANSLLAPLEIMGYFHIKQGNFAALKQVVSRIETDIDTSGFSGDKYEAQYYDLKYQLLQHEGNMAAALVMLEKKTKIDGQIHDFMKQKQLLDHAKELKRLAAEKTIAEKNNQIQRQRLFTIGLIVCSVLLALLVLMTYLYWRNQRKLETEKWMDIQRRREYESQKRLLEERSRIAGEMHDDLGTTLTSTMMAVELIKLKPGDAAPLAMIDRSANQLSDQINEIIWNMNVKNDNLESLSAYILRFASGFLKEASIALSWHEDLKEKNIPVSGRERRNIFLCVKELVNNIVKHAAATKVELDINYYDGTLNIDIRDNGTGLKGSNAATAGSGNGLLNIRKRIAELKGQVSWHSLQPGTHVQMSVPLPNKSINDDNRTNS